MSVFPTNDADLNGILYNLYQEDSENYWSLVSIDGSKVNTDSWSEKHVLINTTNKGEEVTDAWCSDNIPYSHIAIHFSKHYLTLTNYTLRTRTAKVLKGH